MVGDNIKRIRISLGMTQEELAVKTGYTRAGISRIENNERDIATPKVKIFADALGVSPSILMGWQREPMAEDRLRYYVRRLSEINLTDAQAEQVLKYAEFVKKTE